MKRPACRGSSGQAAVSQETPEQQEDSSSRYMMDRQGVVDVRGSAYEEEEEDEDDEEDEHELGGGGRGGLGEKKRRLAAEQVRALERSFEADNKLDPERKARIARELRLHPRQVAVWFQNRRARWKTKQIERDFAALRARHDALRLECDDLRRDKDALAAELRDLRGRLEARHQQVMPAAAVKREPDRPPAAYSKQQVDGSTDSDSSAVFNEEASPYSGGAALDLEHHHPHLHPGFATGFTSFLASSSALGSSFPSMYSAGGSHLDQEAAADGLLGAADGFFAEDQAAGLATWYGAEGW